MNRKKRKWITAAAVLLFFLAGGIWYLLWGKGTGSPVAEQSELQSIFSEATPENAESTAPLDVVEGEAAGKAEASVVVYVCGAVNSPGIYTLSADSRLYEAVTAAGGFLTEADSSYHNLARTIEDGERIYILSAEETRQLTVEERVAGEMPMEENGLVNLNTAGKEQLMALSGIGEAKAEQILEYRKKVGQFTAIEEIMNVSGIGEAMFEKIKENITVK